MTSSGHCDPPGLSKKASGRCSAVNRARTEATSSAALVLIVLASVPPHRSSSTGESVQGSGANSGLMKRRAPFAIGAALLLLGAGCGGTSSSSAAEDVNSNDVYVMLAEQNRSGESGTARLIPLGNQTKVVLELTDPTAT